MKIKLQDLTIDIVQQAFPDVFAKSYGHVSFPNASDSTTSVRNERDLANWKQGIMNVYGNVELEFNPESENWWERVKVLDPKFQANKEKYISAKMNWLDSERSAGRTSGLDENQSEVEYLMSKFYEYRNLAAEAVANGAKEEAADFNKQAMEYYERAMDLEVANMSDSNLSPEDQAMVDDYEEEEANREVPRDYASMYENVTKNNKMKNIDLNRWAKLAGINENDNNVPLNERRIEEFEGHINGLGALEGEPKVFDRVGDIILARYPEEGNSTYRMDVYYNDNNEPTSAKIGFIAGEGEGAKTVNFTFWFKNGEVEDYSFGEQDY